MTSLYQELKRRNVLRMGAFYLALAWLVLQVADVLFEVMGVPPWTMKLIVAVLIIGFPVTLIVAWVFEVTPDGIRREREVDRSTSITSETGHRLNVMTIVVLLAVAALIIIDRVTPPIAPGGPESAAPTDERPTPSATDEPPATSTTAPEVDRPVVAVLPLASRSLEGDGSFLADGIHDDLLTQLAKLDAFRVVSRTSVLQYRGTTKTIREIGEELGATAILEGGVQQAAGRVRINAQLSDAATDTHLWSETFERALSPEDIFAIQAEIAAAIAAATDATLSPDDRATLDDVPTTNLQAYEAFLRGRLLSYTVDPAQVERSLAEFERATALDPDFAEALAWKGYVRMFLAWVTGGTTRDGRALADEGLAEARRARSLKPGLPEADYAEAHYEYWYTKDYERAIDLVDGLIERFPSNVDYRSARGWFNRRYGRWDAAVADMEASIELNPQDPFLHLQLAEFLAQLGRFDEAERQLQAGAAISTDGSDRPIRASIGLLRGDPAALDVEGLCQPTLNLWQNCRALHRFYERRYAEALDLLPPPAEASETGQWTSIVTRLHVLRLLGREDDVRSEAAALAATLTDRLEADPDNAPMLVFLSHARAFLGDTEAALAASSRAEALALPDVVSEAEHRRDRIRFHLLLGDTERALALLDRSLAEPAGYTWAWVEIDPRLDDLRELPGYQALAERYGAGGDAGPSD